MLLGFCNPRRNRIAPKQPSVIIRQTCHVVCHVVALFGYYNSLLMQILLGPHAYSRPATQKLLRAMHDAGVPVESLCVRYLYCVDCASALDQSALRRLRRLLGCSDEPLPAGGVHFRVFPRPGTISPWSSKAGDILRIAGVFGTGRIERGRHCVLKAGSLGEEQCAAAFDLLHDRMTEQVYGTGEREPTVLFERLSPRPLQSVVSEGDPVPALVRANRDWALGLSDEQIVYLGDYYRRAGRPPNDAELMMFSQVNSEHCRHHVFNAEWTIDGVEQDSSLFAMVRATHAASPEGVLVAYEDNAAIVEAASGVRWGVDPETGLYGYSKEPLPVLMKVETHNHPTAISPFAGAATGVGGEIRDEVAAGRGGRPKAGLCGFSVSNLRIPGALRPWEGVENRPSTIASPLRIMLDAPIGAAAFGNEFGRVCLAGYFRTLECFAYGRHWGYHKPIMVAGGMGTLRNMHVRKRKFPAGSLIVVLGGPAMLIGLRGGSTSSRSGGEGDSAALDFASVQRSNPEMQRRCQEVIEQCVSLGECNPILAIHDVGAGGLANAVPELIADAGVGGEFRLGDIPVADAGMSPMEIWCNESQERYVLSVDRADLARFAQVCERERCPFSVIGEAVEGDRLVLSDGSSGGDFISMPLPVLLDGIGRRRRRVSAERMVSGTIDTRELDLDEAVRRVLTLPAVAAKSFLITIGDRTVGGLSVRDQMVGPHQVPVADCAVCSTDFVHYTGEAMAMGERAPVALVDAPASGRLAVAEALTNLLSADVRRLSDIRLSANWMAACGSDEDDFALFETVKSVTQELCVALGIAIPVGKDSLSMQTVWRDGEGSPQQFKSPLSLVVSAFASVGDVRRSWTPELVPDADCPLFVFELSNARHCLGASALAQVFGLEGGPCADFDEPERLKSFAALLADLRARKAVRAYHDRSDGGLFTTLCEMAFAGHCGLDVRLDSLEGDVLPALFSEGAGAVLQLTPEGAKYLATVLERYGLGDVCRPVARPVQDKTFSIAKGAGRWEWDLMELKRLWWDTAYRIQSLRDNADCAREELEDACNVDRRGLGAELNFDPDAHDGVGAAAINRGARPRLAVLREQGVNGHMEMAASFDRAGFDAVDVHMSDLLAARISLKHFHGLAACGGFSYGDVLGAGAGWAAGILYNDGVRAEFSSFFSRDDAFALGVCNGCQMLSRLKELIPGAMHFPAFGENASGRFEARLCMVGIMDSPSILFRGMAGSRLPAVVAHGEGRVVFGDAAQADAEPYVCLRYIDDSGAPALRYPANPNGSPGGITSLCNRDGRVTLMMPHPERLFRTVQYSWHPRDWKENSPWFRLFVNARRWLDGKIA